MNTPESRRDEPYYPYFEMLMDANPSLKPYRQYLFDRGGFGSVIQFLSDAKLPPEYFSGKTVLDIGGGSFNPVESSYDYFPWYSIAVILCGARVMNIDRRQSIRCLSDMPDLAVFFDTHKRSYTHIPYDLSYGLRHTDDLIGYVFGNRCDIPGSVDVVHSDYLVSFNPQRGLNSPLFKQTLGTDYTEDGTVRLNKKNYDRFCQSGFGIIAIAGQVLRNGGYIHYNSCTFVKRGDTFVWIPRPESAIRSFQSPIP